MLSKHERDRLAEIESGLVSDDPRFAEKFDRFEPGRHVFGLWSALVVLGCALVAVLISALLVSGQFIAAAVVGGLALIGGALGGWQARRRSGRRRR